MYPFFHKWDLLKQFETMADFNANWSLMLRVIQCMHILPCTVYVWLAGPAQWHVGTVEMWGQIIQNLGSKLTCLIIGWDIYKQEGKSMVPKISGFCSLLQLSVFEDVCLFVPSIICIYNAQHALGCWI